MGFQLQMRRFVFRCSSGGDDSNALVKGKKLLDSCIVVRGHGSHAGTVLDEF